MRTFHKKMQIIGIRSVRILCRKYRSFFQNILQNDQTINFIIAIYDSKSFYVYGHRKCRGGLITVDLLKKDEIFMCHFILDFRLIELNEMKQRNRSILRF